SEVVLSGPAELVAPLVAVVERTLGERLLSPAGFPLSVRLAGSPQEIVLRGAAALVLWDRLGVV
ncbi:MAG: ROK family transcriptional regulator, partial [Ornithinibacter sp.]